MPLVQNIEKSNTNMRPSIPLEKRVGIALYSLGSSAEYKIISSLFGVGRSTVGEIMVEFCKAVCSELKGGINTYPPKQEDV